MEFDDNGLGHVDMTLVVVALVVAAVAAGAIVGYYLHRGTPAEGTSIGEEDQYLRAARNALAEGQQAVLDLEQLDEPVGLAALDTEDLRLTIGRIDVFSSLMTQVTCLAPTSMDARVSRSVAVSATAIGDMLRDERERRWNPDGTVSPSARTFVQRRSELVLALQDLHNHVELL